MEVVKECEPLFLIQAHLVPGVPQGQPALLQLVQLDGRPPPPSGNAGAVLSSQLPTVPPPPHSNPESAAADVQLPPLGAKRLLLVQLGVRRSHVNMEYGVWIGVWSMEYVAWSMEYGVWNME